MKEAPPSSFAVVLLASFATQSLSCCFEVLVPAHALQLLGVGAAEWAKIRLGKSVAVALAMCVLGSASGSTGAGGGGGGGGSGGGCAAARAARRRAALAAAALGTLALAALACALLGAAPRACFGWLFPLAGALNSAAAVQLQALTQLLSTAAGGGGGGSGLMTPARGNMWLRLSGSLAALLLPLVLSSLTLAAALPFLLAASAACAAASWLHHRPAVASAASAVASSPAQDLGARSSDPARGVGGWGAGGLLLLLRGAGAFVSQRTILAPSAWSARRAPLSRLVCCAAASSALVGTVLQSYAFFHLTAAAAGGGNQHSESRRLGMQLSIGAFGALHSATAALGMLSIAAHARLAALPAVGAKRCAVGSMLACALCAAGLGRATSAANAAAWYAAALALHQGAAVPLTMWVAVLSDRGEQLGAAAKQKVAAAAFNATCVTAAGALIRAGLSSRAIFGVVGAACAANAMLLARIPGTRRIAAAATPEPGAAVAAAAERSTKTKTKIS